VGDVVQFVRAAIGPWCASRAALVVVGLDAANRVGGLAENRRRWSLRSLGVAELVALAGHLDARALVLVQFVPNKRAAPSAPDANAFRALARRCAADHVHVLDCIVVSAGRWWSLARLAADSAASN
jgi:DNA repair protein RadC